MMMLKVLVKKST